MLTDTDYNIFADKWNEYLMFSGVDINKKQMLLTMLAIKNAKCTKKEFIATVDTLIASDIKNKSLESVLMMSQYQWMTIDDIKNRAFGIYRLLTLNAKATIDFVFGDERACMSFYLVFGNLEKFLKADLDEKDNSYSDRFIDCYINSNVNDYFDVIKANRIMFSQSRTKPCNRQEVCFIGDNQNAKNIADSFYGNGNYVIYRSDINGSLKKKDSIFNEREKEKSRLLLSVNLTKEQLQAQKKERLSQLENVLFALKGGNRE